MWQQRENIKSKKKQKTQDPLEQFTAHSGWLFDKGGEKFLPSHMVILSFSHGKDPEKTIQNFMECHGSVLSKWIPSNGLY